MEILINILVVLGGMAAGTVFFGGLWYTTRKAMHSKAPAIWVMGSFITRMACALTCFYYLGGGIWQRLLLCLGGFVVARILIIRLTRSAEDGYKLKKGGDYAVKS